MQMNGTAGIHHITAIASNGRQNIEFYTGLLGLRLVKKTVNQDDVSTYHLFYGDREGNPGMDLTFFIFRPAIQGKRGNGLVTNISLAVPENALSFWQKRFEQNNVNHKMYELFGQKRILFFDRDNQQLELVGMSDLTKSEDSRIWTKDDISEENAIRHFHSAALSVEHLSQIQLILKDILGYAERDHDGDVIRFEVSGSNRAYMLEVNQDESIPYGVNAAGTVHHIAFRAKDEEEQATFTQRIMELGLYPTQVIDRYYFKSVYFRTPAGILFEIATDGPGFTVDEGVQELGQKLVLPPFLEGERRMIEENLPPLSDEPVVLQ